MLRVGVVIPAGGTGKRMGAKVPKQFLLLGGRSVLQRTLARFESISDVNEIVLVVPKNYWERARSLVKRVGFRKVRHVVVGGRQRQDSVWNGLNAFELKPDIVLVHDAVRPMVTDKVVKRVIRKAVECQAAAVGIRLKDTVKVERRKGFFTHTLNRSKLWAVQTPQGFQFDLLMRAHRVARRKGLKSTDEASLVERLRMPVAIVEGDEKNIKITTKQDLEMARLLLK